MHIPDNFLDPKTAIITGSLAAAGLGAALHHARKHLPPRKVPLLGLTAAFVFAAQMLNFPVLGGTSGHLIGAVLTAVLLGPSAAVIVIAAVLIIQCLLFADGGITALGANIFNMALIGGVGGWAVFALLQKLLPANRIGRTLAIVLAAWSSTVLASIACAGELAASHTVGWFVAFPAMTAIHALIGVGEAIITAMVINAITQTRPELLASTPPEAAHIATARNSNVPTRFGLASTPSPSNLLTLLTFGLLISLGLAIFVAPFACPWPDGLDKTAETLGFAHRAAEAPLLAAPMTDYQMPGISSEGVATATAGAAGTLIIFGLVYLAARALLPRLPRTHPPANAA
ncbi:MAG: energy-coupling factor ABC transporter permease [Phycisphaerales bacterium]